ncbi:alpha/beta fold hydrolase [Cryobacterium sp. Hh7]|uniref:alpha/beta fold hydrolase n=1 Tax=Cryobacterium sp. Hh7 TaxID=1259159 RepID=UPI00106B8912|nr:alpha/beta fold hydrolase [Cryobacterium sp. Hh7]TFD56958.1 alpha/beta fold hydrolase [Cryobacterium sp. Hh7]
MKIDTAWGTMNAIDEGDGPLVVLLHPLAQGAELWRPVIDRLSPQFRVVAPDARGHGDSSWDGEPFTITDLADDVAGLINRLQAGPAMVIAMSMGGCTAIDLAVRHADQVSRLVLADTTSDYGAGKEQTWETRAQNAQSKTREQQLTFQHDRWFSPWFLQNDPAEVARVSDIFVQTDSGAHAAACRALGAFNDSDQLVSIKAPTLVVVGAEDYATPPLMASVISRNIPGSRLLVLPDTRHLSLLQNPTVWSTITDFLGF